MLDTIPTPRSIKCRKFRDNSQLHSYKLWHSKNWYHVRVPKAHIEALMLLEYNIRLALELYNSGQIVARAFHSRCGPKSR